MLKQSCLKGIRPLLRKALPWENPQTQWRRGPYVPINGQILKIL
ncbi:hypothetical protein OKW24_004988 [Peribacillus simplex]|nr:hypothetical protein [Peribacillus simplex]